MSRKFRVPEIPTEPGTRSPAREAESAAHHPGLDGLRGVAVLLVLLLHFVQTTSAQRVGTSLFHSLTQFGWIGVDLFFVLSGFLITGILLDTRASPHYYRSFYARRALRTLPLYYTALGVVLVIQALAMARGGTTDLRPHALLWVHLANVAALLEGGQWVTAVGVAHLWTLSIEEHFYALWPPVVRRCGARGLAAMVALVIVGAILCRYWAGTRWSPLAGYVLTPCRMDLLAMGGILALAIRNGWTVARLRGFLRPAGATALAVLIALWIGQRRTDPFDLTIQFAGFPCIAVIAAALLAEGLRSAKTSEIGRLFELPALRCCGKYSYGLYVWHGLLLPFSAPLHKSLTRLTGSGLLGFALYLSAVLSLSAVAAYLSYRFLEQPFLRLKRRFPYGSEGSGAFDRNIASKPGSPSAE